MSFAQEIKTQLLLLGQNPRARQELKDLLRLYGEDARTYLFSLLFEEIDFSQYKAAKYKHKIQLITEEFNTISSSSTSSDRPKSAVVVCKALEALPSFKADILTDFSKALSPSLTQQLQIAMLCAQSLNSSVQEEGLRFLKNKILDSSAFNQERLPEAVVFDLLLFINSTSQLSEQQRQEATNLLKSSYPEAYSAYRSGDRDLDSKRPYESSSSSRISDAVQEIGYGATESVESFSRVIGQFEKDKINVQTAASLLAMMARTQSSLSADTFSFNSIVSMATSDEEREQKDKVSSLRSWSAEVFVGTWSQLISRISWEEVFDHLDLPEFRLTDSRGLQFLVDVWRIGSQNRPFPLHIAFRDWQNTEGQFSLLRFALTSVCDPHAFFETRTDESSPNSSFAASDALIQSLSSEEKKTGIHFWTTLDIVETLQDVNEMDLYVVLKTLFARAVEKSSELATSPLFSPSKKANELPHLLLPVYLGIFVSSPFSSSFLHLYQTKPHLVTHWLLKMHMKDPSFISRILDLAQSFRDSLAVLLNSSSSSLPLSLVLDIATLSQRKEVTDFDRWFQVRISEYGGSFVESLLKYLRDSHPQAHSQQTDNGSSLLLSPELVAVFLRSLLVSKSFLSPEQNSALEVLHAQFSALYPSFSQINTAVQAPVPSALPDDIEEEANGYFQKIYTQQLTLPEVIDMLQRLKASAANSRPHLLFQCMLHNLFDEYQFFHKYPKKELEITSELFGLLVRDRVVSGFGLGVALRSVLEALRKPIDSKMFHFGLRALQTFQTRLPVWPQYCSLLLSIPHLRSHLLSQVSGGSELVTLIEGVANQSQGSNLPSLESADSGAQNREFTAGFGMSSDATFNASSLSMLTESEAKSANILSSGRSSQTSSQSASSAPSPSRSPTLSPSRSPSFPSSSGLNPPEASLTSTPVKEGPTSSQQAKKIAASQPTFGGIAVSIEPLLQAEQASGKSRPLSPRESEKDKIHFLINSVSKINLKQKGKDLKNILTSDYYPYFARYLVIRRVCVEANNQRTYAQFLEATGSPELMKVVLQTTYDNILLLIQSEKIINSTAERSLLKNLGMWLGLITIARNKPVRARHLPLKELILEAYDSGRLIAVIPFVAKVLESCAESRVFRPPNPWLAALLSLLKEIFDLPGLKLNLKFEIEVLLQSLGVAMKDVKPSNILKSPRHQPPLFNFRSDSSKEKSPSLVAEAPSASRMPSLLSSEPGEESQILGGGLGSPTGTSSRPVPSAQREGGPSASQSYETPSGLTNNLPNYININQSLVLFQMYPQLKRLVPQALDRAIREIISPVVDRSVTIACVTTRELILKDFNNERDEARIRHAAHLMAQNLTASLALVTCKEPLRVNINNHLASLLENQVANVDRSIVEQAINSVSSENLELGCALIEKAAAERAVREIDDALSPFFELRRKQLLGAADASALSKLSVPKKYASILPDNLQVTGDSLTPQQFRVYEDFSRIRQYAQSISSTGSQSVSAAAAAAAAAAKVATNPAARSSTTTPAPAPTAPLSTGASTHVRERNAQLMQQMMKDFLRLLESLEKAALSFPEHKTQPLHTLIQQAGREEHQINVFLRYFPTLFNQAPTKNDEGFQREALAVACAQKVFKRMYERDFRTSLLCIDVHISVLKCIRAFSPKVVNEITAWLFYSDDDRKFILPITIGLIRARMLNLTVVDETLAKLAFAAHASGQAIQTQTVPAIPPATGVTTKTVLHAHLDFILSLIRRLVVRKAICQVSDFSKTIDVISNIVLQTRNKLVAEHLQHLLDEVRAAAASESAQPPQNGEPAAPVPVVEVDPIRAIFESYSYNVLNEDDTDILDRETEPTITPTLRATLHQLWEEWMNVSTSGNERSVAPFLQIFQQNRIVAEHGPALFRTLVQLAVESSLAQTGENAQPSYVPIDALSKLIFLFIKFANLLLPGNNGNEKLTLLKTFVLAACSVTRREYANLQANFNQKPFIRLFTNLLQDLNTPDSKFDSSRVEVLLVLSFAFFLLRPSRVPGFVFSWLELIAHRMFMPKLLLSRSTQCASAYQRLLAELLRFMQPFLRNAELTESVRLIYKGTLRLLLVLLHDFPEFLCEYHFTFCDLIPTSCIQMRNLILSAFPRNMRLPDPFTPNLKVDLLPEIHQSPRIVSNFTQALSLYRDTLQIPLDNYLKTRQPASFLKQLLTHLTIAADPSSPTAAESSAIKRAGTNYNIPLLNSLILYVGTQGNLLFHNKGLQFQEHPSLDVFTALVNGLDAEGRYYVISSIANQLRFPNNNTHYFSCVLLHLFLHSKDEVIMEQITRVLLERLIVHRPHPWGLLVTFIELIKNPRYEFWKQSFTRCAPEIERLFDSVARSCIPSASPSTSVTTAAAPKEQP